MCMPNSHLPKSLWRQSVWVLNYPSPLALHLRAFSPQNHNDSQHGALPILPVPPPLSGATLTAPTTATSSIGSTSTCRRGLWRSYENTPSSEDPPQISSSQHSLIILCMYNLNQYKCLE